MVVIQRHVEDRLCRWRIDFADYGGNGKRVGRVVRNKGCRMAVSGTVRADPRVNQRVRHYRMVVGIESDGGQLAEINPGNRDGDDRSDWAGLT
jgi:hypothetical protein